MSETQAIQMQEETNRIVQEIESQKLDNDAAASFIYALFAVVAISMVIESFVKNYKDKIYEKKRAGQKYSAERKKLWITYLIHIPVLLLIWCICSFLLNISSPYVGFLIIVSIFMVEIAPLFTIHLNFKKEIKE